MLTFMLATKSVMLALARLTRYLAIYSINALKRDALARWQDVDVISGSITIEKATKP